MTEPETCNPGACENCVCGGTCNSSTCVLDENEPCVCEDDQQRCILLQKYRKVVYCKAYKCLWNEAIPFEKIVKPRTHHYEPFPDAGIRGICGRPELAINWKEYEDARHNVVKEAGCANYSDYKVKGHLDFSRFPTGGHIGTNLKEV